ncbi:LysR substrate-binding domain-containing protein [Streptomyces collinus]|uniref:LysR substrate-binding domain-containing protein n=1 Tax=Streptomyces TaxID=1883 RepID=UPI00343FA955
MIVTGPVDRQVSSASSRRARLVVEYNGDDPDPYEQWQGRASAPIADDEYRVVTPADWSPSPRSVRDLADRPWVTTPPGTACGRALARISAQYAYTPSRAHTAREFPTTLSLVRAGLGTAVVLPLALTGAPPAVAVQRSAA